MNKPIDIRTVDEWMYAVSTALRESKEKDTQELLQRVLDDMRERRSHLELLRHNEVGY